MNELAKKNIECLAEKMKDIEEGIVNYVNKNGNQDKTVYIDRSANEEPILAKEKEGRMWYLNSRYDVQYAAKVLADAQGEIHYRNIFILCGLGNGMYLQELLKRLGDENIVIAYEPDPEVFVSLIENVDMTESFGDRRVLVFAEGINTNTFSQYFGIIFRYELIDLSKFIIAPNYGRLYAEQIQEFHDMCWREANMLQGEKNTLADIGYEMADNVIANLWNMSKHSTVNELAEYFENAGVDTENVPFLIVSAGPSLDKNIEDVRAAKGHAFVVAVDSAIRKMLEYNIMPDIIVTVDSHKPLVLFEDERVKHIPMVVCGQSRQEVYRQHKAKMFVFTEDEFVLYFYRHFGHDIAPLRTGGSVANNAFSLALLLGFKKIILVGQDLAFTNNKKHASNVYEESGISEEDSYKYTYVTDINGEQILTFRNFAMYKDWFEGVIRDNEDVKVLNATEGGANIKGAENCTLKEAIARWCNVSFNASIINNVPDVFADEEITSVYDYIVEMHDRCDELNKSFNEEIKNYMRLKELIAEGKTGGSAFNSVMKKIQKFNDMANREPLVHLISMYSSKNEHEALEGLYEEKKSADREAMTAADKGIALLEGYKQGCELTKQAFGKLIDSIEAEA